MIYIGSDHRGFDLKEALKKYLTDKKLEVFDCGNTVKDPNDDYPDFALAVGERVAHDMEGKGIVICGGGAGVVIAANKVKGIRAVQGFDINQVKAARNDDDMNVLALGSDLVTVDQATQFVDVFLETKYGALERYDRRKQKIEAYEESSCGDCGEGCCGNC